MEELNHEKYEKHERVLYAEDAFRIQGAIFEVSRQMGTGFLESVYQECLHREFARRGISFSAQPRLKLTYRGETLNQTFVPDFVCFDTILVELKAVREIAPEHRAQVINYLKATGLKLGLLVNFGNAPKARCERIVL